jgi:Zn-dependent peptidase ImmA (M78 family)
MPETVDQAAPFVKRAEIETKAYEVLKRHMLTTVPVDLVTLAEREGITINNARFDDDDTAGMIIKRGGDVSILVKGDDRPYRKQFTIAHELGHYFLHLTDDGEYIDKDANLFRRQPGEGTTPERGREIQANMFAASLLMPEGEVRRYWQKYHSIGKLARIFNVSEEAMGYRVDSLGLD